MTASEVALFPHAQVDWWAVEGWAETERPRANGRRAPAAHRVVWEGEQLEEAGLEGDGRARPRAPCPAPGFSAQALCAGLGRRGENRKLAHSSLLSVGLGSAVEAPSRLAVCLGPLPESPRCTLSRARSGILR